MKRNVAASALALVGLAAIALAGFGIGGLPGTVHSQPQQAPAPSSPLTLAVYALDTCPVSGGKLGSMGDPLIREYDGREVRLCCAGCLGSFEGNREAHFKAIDAKLIEQQRSHYPLEVCLVSGNPLGENASVVEIIHQGRLVRFCCPNCPPRFEANPGEYMPKLDAAIIEQQRASYPLETCVVAGQRLGSMGDPVERIIGSTLVRLCCAGCLDSLQRDPLKYLATVQGG